MPVRQPLERIRAALRNVLPGGLTVDIESRDAVAPTFAVAVRAAKSEHRFVAGWAGEGWPADVERLVTLAGEVDVVSARDLSVGAREWLEERGIGWIDESGRSNLSLPTGLVVVRDVADPEPRPVAHGWSASTVAVAEAALSGTDPRVASIQNATGLSRGATAKALAYLESLGLLRREIARGPGSARQVSDAAALLESYAAAVAILNAKIPVALLHRLWGDPITCLESEIAPALDATETRWAATGEAASILLAPYLSNVSIVELYVEPELLDDRSRLTELFDARVVRRGHRIEVRPLPNRITAIAGATVDGVRCASLPRVYADLLAKGGRFAEAANHLREVLHVGTPA